MFNMFALALDNNETSLDSNVDHYAILLFSGIPPRAFVRRDDAQRVVIRLNGSDENTRACDYGFDAKEAWCYHADAVLVPPQVEFQMYLPIIEAIRADTYSSIGVWLVLPAELASSEHLQMLDTMQVRAVVLAGAETVQRACAVKRKYHLSLRVLAQAAAHACAAGVHNVRQAGAEHVILTSLTSDQSTLEACERVRERYELTFGSGRKTLRTMLVNGVNVVQQVPETQAPFVTKSGLETRTYLDLRRLVSYPKYLMQVATALLGLVRPNSFDVIAGVPTGAVPLAVVMSQLSGKPLIMLRDKPKTYGMRKQVEGVFQFNRHCLLVEDVTTTGMSILNMVHVVRKAGMKVDQAVVVVARDRHKPYSLLEKAKCTLNALFTLNDAMQLE